MPDISDLILASDNDGDGVGDIIFKTGGVERARIKADGTGSGWPAIVGGALSLVNPVALYHMDANAGTSIADSSGHGHTGTAAGTNWLPGHLHSCLQFGVGGNGTVDIGALGTFYKTAFTLEAWIFRGNTGLDQGIIACWAAGTGGGPALWTDDVSGTLRLTLTNNFVNYVDSGVVIPANVWTHVAGTYDGAVGTLYINGLIVGTKAFAGNVGDTNAWRIGSFPPNGTTQVFVGLIDEVAIYNRCLTQEQIIADMRAT